MPKTRFVLAFLFMISMLGAIIRPASPALAAGTATISGMEVQWGLPWGKAPTTFTSGQQPESVSLAYGSALVVIAEINSTDAQVDQVNSILSLDTDESARDSHVIVDGDDSSYELGHFTVDNEVRGYFYLVFPNAASIAQLFVAPVEKFGTLFESAQTTITLDETQVFDQVESDGLAELLGAGPSVAKSPTKESEPVVASDPRDSYSWIDARDLLIRPDSFTGEKIAIAGSVFNIQVSDGNTFMQIYVDGGNYDAVVVVFEGDSIGIYEDTWVTIYGTGAGTYEGTNSFGGTIVQPLVFADIVDY